MQKTNYHFTHKVWKIEILNSKQLIVELRDTTNYKTTWKIIDIYQEHCSYTIDNLTNSWWKSLVSVHGNYLIFHELQQGKNPEIAGTEVFDLSTKKNVFYPSYQYLDKNDAQLVLEHVQKEKIVIESQKKTFLLLDPITYKQENEYFDTFRQIIAQNHKEKICLECEYIETDQHVIIGYYTLIAEQIYQSKILVMNILGEKIYQEVTNKELNGSVFGMFFIHSNTLIYISDETTVTCLSF